MKTQDKINTEKSWSLAKLKLLKKDHKPKSTGCNFAAYSTCVVYGLTEAFTILYIFILGSLLYFLHENPFQFSDKMDDNKIQYQLYFVIIAIYDGCTEIMCFIQS